MNFLVLILRDNVLEWREGTFDQIAGEDGGARSTTDLEEDLIAIPPDTDWLVRIVHESIENVQRLGGDDRGEVLFGAGGAFSPGDRESTAIGRDEAEVSSDAFNQHAVDRISTVLDGGREDGASDQSPECLAVGFEFEVVRVERRDAGELLRIESEHFKFRVAAGDGGDVLRDFDRQRVVVAGSDDLVQLVGGNQGDPFFAHIHFGDAEEQADFCVGGRDEEKAILRLEFEAEQHGRRGPTDDDASGDGKGFSKGITTTNELHVSFQTGGAAGHIRWPEIVGLEPAGRDLPEWAG